MAFHDLFLGIEVIARVFYQLLDGQLGFSLIQALLDELQQLEEPLVLILYLFDPNLIGWYSLYLHLLRTVVWRNEVLLNPVNHLLV